ncbi:hypothetical protein [Pelosinus propionicus]|uniref:Uncharacterized protein n=1 Tax=Pelosinus propionicus DSM 13327 TaxID=1123291 RepID=A0A1I4LBG9_9FIRM|nr:hypothetical protein [Pelosinus propionicus]SFL88219.1 hypothetical protein SAMN04490355_102382 [Pelosinus propionicus DSM 13327]
MTTLNAIIMEVGKDPAVYKLSTAIDKQLEEIASILGGNFVSSRLFEVGNGLSLHIFLNDMAIPLQLTANRRFPEPDQDQIIYGNALFLIIDDTNGDEEGALDIPNSICDIFISKLKESLLPCNGDEKPNLDAEIFVENPGTNEERQFKWEEVQAPGKEEELKFIGQGYVRIVDDGICDILEVRGRYFKQKYLKKKQKNFQ